MRILKLAAVLLAAAFGASAVALAVERPAKQDDDEQAERVASISGVLSAPKPAPKPLLEMPARPRALTSSSTERVEMPWM